MKEASFYKETGPEGEVSCFLCAHGCRIPRDGRGFCKVRENRGGKLYSLVYGRVSNMDVEFIEKKPLYHFLPGSTSLSIGTPGCNFQCPWCQNWRLSRVSNAERFEQRPFTEPELVVERALLEDCRSICYTYNEPTIFMEYVLDTAELAHQKNLLNVMVTNGYQSDRTVGAMRGLIDAVNVDVKSFSDSYYRRFCGARLQPVLDTVRHMHAAGMHVEITTLLVPGLNDDEEEIRGIARFIASVSPEIPWHITRFHPDYEARDIAPTPPESIKKSLETAAEEGLRYLYAGNIDIPEFHNTRCAQCGEVTIARDPLGRATAVPETESCPSCGTFLEEIVLDR